MSVIGSCIPGGVWWADEVSEGATCVVCKLSEEGLCLGFCEGTHPDRGNLRNYSNHVLEKCDMYDTLRLDLPAELFVPASWRN